MLSSASAEADRLRLCAAALRLDGGWYRDTPDAKRDVFGYLGSPVSPAKAAAAGHALLLLLFRRVRQEPKTPALCNAAVERGGGVSGRASGSYSGELVAESSSGNAPRPPGHGRSGSGLLIFSGGSGGSGGGAGVGARPPARALECAPSRQHPCAWSGRGGRSPDSQATRPLRRARCSDPARGTTATAAS